jgi:hypothetical protein
MDLVIINDMIDNLVMMKNPNEKLLLLDSILYSLEYHLKHISSYDTEKVKKRLQIKILKKRLFDMI